MQKLLISLYIKLRCASWVVGNLKRVFPSATLPYLGTLHQVGMYILELSDEGRQAVGGAIDGDGGILGA
jgi:hypothetical protein